MPRHEAPRLEGNIRSLRTDEFEAAALRMARCATRSMLDTRARHSMSEEALRDYDLMFEAMRIIEPPGRRHAAEELDAAYQAFVRFADHPEVDERIRLVCRVLTESRNCHQPPELDEADAAALMQI
ncbi:hypothetical protein JNW90_21150 [Micromonospora sp. STR1s_5]|nr:hypothetical protein [Micromonospora sp. STR1s_5]